MIKIYNNINPTKFTDELIYKKIFPLLVSHNRIDGDVIANNTTITFKDDVDMELVKLILDEHDPNVNYIESNEVEELKQALAELTILISNGGM